MHLCKAESILIAPFKELKQVRFYNTKIHNIVLIEPFKELKLFS